MRGERRDGLRLDVEAMNKVVLSSQEDKPPQWIPPAGGQRPAVLVFQRDMRVGRINLHGGVHAKSSAIGPLAGSAPGTFRPPISNSPLELTPPAARSVWNRCP